MGGESGVGGQQGRNEEGGAVVVDARPTWLWSTWGERQTEHRTAERERSERIEERGREGLTGGPRHHHVSSMWTKPSTKITRWPNMNGFVFWVAKDFRFCSLIVKTKLR